ncbi:hypothetical protein AVEN_154788-1 [Araneus ventricosus]|uniref:Uncharacterized protein n=1 Tax=Araneus ventricosus TaxID=182803 RepID=A0A4Y2BT50_ARAVE|nr:hypothetical protein AVEN_154788-1 [Araneus ventricosus]
MSSEVMFNITMIRTVSYEKFMANPKHKDRLISILMNKFSVNMTYKKADEDADCLIVKSIALAPTHSSVVVISEDIELFVILIGICTFDNVYFLKLEKGKSLKRYFLLTQF